MRKISSFYTTVLPVLLLGLAAGLSTTARAQDNATSVTYTILNTCANSFGDSANFDLQIAGTTVGNIGGGGDCTCAPPLRTFTTTAPADLALVAEVGCPNVAVQLNGTSYVAWARIEVTRAISGTEVLCARDVDGGNCDEVNLCTAGYSPQVGNTTFSVTTDTDGDGDPDCTDPDDDNDGVLDGADNCPVNANPLQEDTNGNGVGDICSPNLAAVPFRGNLNNSHPVYNGGTLTLQAAATMPASGEAVALDSGTWDPGDGSGPQSINVSDSRALELTHVYTGSTGQPYTAIISVVDSGGNTHTDTFKVKIQDDTLDTRSDMARDLGLWNLYKRAQLGTSSNGVATAKWERSGTTYEDSATAAAVQAMEINGHLESGDPLENPYVSVVSSGLAWLFDSLEADTLSLQGGNDPDGDGDTIGLRARSTNGHYNYITGQIMDAIVASGTPNATATTGIGSVLGVSYRDIMQDMIDQYAWGAVDGAVPGGWLYTSFNNSGYPTANDSSASHWWAIGTIAAETWGLDSPQWLKDQNFNSAIPQWQPAPNGSGTDTCACGYRQIGQFTWDGGWNTTAACLIMMNADDIPKTHPRFQCGERWLAANFYGPASGGGNFSGYNGNWYDMFQTKKVMLTALNNAGEYEPIDLLGGTIDWYDEYSQQIVDNQSADGSWNSWSVGIAGSQVSGDLRTAWAIIILTPSLFEQGPVAECTADPSVAGLNQNVNFDASGSSHQNPNGSIASYEWDLDGDGTFNDATGVNSSFAYTSTGVVPVSVRVTDAGGLTDTASCPVTVTDLDTPPNANIKITGTVDPITFCAGDRIVLDGSESTDLESNIVLYEWDVTSPLNFSPVDGNGVNFDASALLNSAGSYNVGLRVTDSDTIPKTNAEFKAIMVLDASDPLCNQPPDAVDDNETTNEDTPVTFSVVANDTDPDGNLDPATANSTSVPSFGGLVDNGGGSFTYTPNLNYNGADSFSYQVCDTKGECDTATVSITINAVNDAPDAVDDSDTTNEDTPVTTSVLGNDNGGPADEDQALTVDAVTQGSNGSVSTNGTTTTYTPNPNFNGSDSYTYTISDSEGLTDTATVSITINAVKDAPDAVDDSDTTNEDTPVTTGVLGNDNGGPADEDQTLTVDAVTQGSNGSVSTNGTTTTYTPNPNFNGSDSYTYTISDSDGLSDTATVSITINAVNDAPDAVDDSDTTNEDTPVTTGVLGNDNGGPADEDQALTVDAVTQGANGSVSTNGTTTTYTPNPNFNGSDSYTYTISDSEGLTDTATVSITINAVNDAPDAVDDNASTNEDTPVTTGVLGNDNGGPADEDQTLTVTGKTDGANGTVSCTATNCTYTPNADFNGSDSYTYTISDSEGLTDTATVSVTVIPVNDAPDAVDDSDTTNEDTPVTTGVLGNDNGGPADEDQTLTVDAVTQGANGSVSTNGTTTTYTPNPNFNGSDSYTYTISDSEGLTDTATVSITINAVNDAPDAVDDNASTNEDTPVTTGVLGNDNGGPADEDQTLTVTGKTDGANGTVSCTATNCTYTPNADFNGSDSYTYTISDSEGLTDTATVSVTVIPVNDAPDAVDDSDTTNEDTPVTTGVLGNDNGGPADEDQTLTVDAVTQGANGSVSTNGTTTTYTPNPNFNGSDSYTYTISDSEGLTDTATVSITINAVNDAPDAVDDNASTNEDTPVTTGVLGNDNGGPADEDQTLTVTGKTDGANGTVSCTATNCTYTPNADFNGSDSYTYTISDSEGLTDTATVSVTVIPVNDAPDAVDDNASTNEDTPVTTGVLGNDNGGPADEDQALTVDAVTQGANGSVSTNGTTTTYTPNLNYYGNDSYTYTISDSEGLTDTATVSVTVIPVNDAPDAVDDSDTTNEDTQVTTNVLDNDNGGPVNEDQTLTVTGTTDGANGTTTTNGTTVTYTPNANYNGPDSYTYTISDSGGLTDTATVSITVNPVNDGPGVSANDDTAQYSDPVLVTISGSDIDSTSLSIVTTALPAGLSLSAASCSVNADAPPGGLDCTWTVSGNVTAAPGTYSVDVTVTDNGELTDATSLSADTTFEITVEQEDARSTYTGPLFLGSEENGDFNVTLMATIRDITVVSGDPAEDPDAGVITNASVHFEDETGATLCSASAVTLVFSGNEQVGSASCVYSGSLASNEDELPLEITVVVGDHYVDDSDNEVVVLISRPGAGKITGGGQLELANSAGVYTAEPNARTNYGFNAQATKKGKKTQLKGRVTIIVRGADGHKYKIKSNAMQTLGVDLGVDPDEEPYYAELDTKANLTDLTDPLNPVSLGGGLLLQLRMHDNGEPGENDTISFALWDGGTLLFSTNWDGAQTVEETVARGNLQVHP